MYKNDIIKKQKILRLKGFTTSTNSVTAEEVPHLYDLEYNGEKVVRLFKTSSEGRVYLALEDVALREIDLYLPDMFTLEHDYYSMLDQYATRDPEELF